MITAEDILNMNFYKKEKFTGRNKIPLKIQPNTLKNNNIF